MAHCVDMYLFRPSLHDPEKPLPIGEYHSTSDSIQQLEDEVVTELMKYNSGTHASARFICDKVPYTRAYTIRYGKVYQVNTGSGREELVCATYKSPLDGVPPALLFMPM